MVLVIFILYAVLHLCLFTTKSIDPLKLWKGIAFLFFYVFIKSIKDEERQFILYALIASGIIQSVIVFGQFFGLIESKHPHFQITGTFGNPGQLGGYLAVCFVATLGNIKLLRKQFLIIWQVSAVVVVCAALLLADSRAGWLAAMIGGCFNFRKEIHSCWKRYTKVCIPIVLIATVLMGLLLYNYRPESANGRMLIWRVCGEMISDKPLFGHGIGSFHKKYMFYQADYFREYPNSSLVLVADNVGYPYNEFLYVAVELGLVGFLLMCVLFVLPFVMRIRNGQERLFLSILLCLIVFSMFSYPIQVFSLFLLFPLSLRGGTIGKIYIINKPRCISALCVLATVGICVLAVAECRFYEQASWRIKNMASKKELASSPFINNNFGRFVNNLNFNAVYAESVFLSGTDIPSNVMECFTPTCETYCDIGNFYFKKADFVNAEFYYKAASWMIPNRILPNYFLWQLYMSMSDGVNAKIVANRILFQPLKVENTITIRIKAEVKEWLNNQCL